MSIPKEAAWQEGFTRPTIAIPWSGTLAEQFLSPEPEPQYIVKDFMQDGDNILIPAMRKSGKTTLGFNICASLVDGKPFLGKFPTRLPEGKTVEYWNMELGKARAQYWLKDMGILHTDLLYVEHLRGTSIDLTNRSTQDMVIEHLLSRNVGVWTIDPLGAIYQGNENDNDLARQWTNGVDRIRKDAGVNVAIVISHTGHSAEGRTRGASRFEDWADESYTYTHDGEHGQKAPSNMRYLSQAIGGRGDVDIESLQLDYEKATRRLFVHGAQSRKDAREMRMFETIVSVVTKNPDMSKTKLNGAIRKLKVPGCTNATEVSNAIDECESLGFISMKQKGSAKCYYIDDSDLIS